MSKEHESYRDKLWQDYLDALPHKPHERSITEANKKFFAYLVGAPLDYLAEKGFNLWDKRQARLKDERARAEEQHALHELLDRDTKQLLEEAKNLPPLPNLEDLGAEVGNALRHLYPDQRPLLPVFEALASIAEELAEIDDRKPEPYPGSLETVEAARFRDQLRLYILRHRDPQKTAKHLEYIILLTYHQFLSKLPSTCFTPWDVPDPPTSFTIDLVSLIKDQLAIYNALTSPVFEPDPLSLFTQHKIAIIRNKQRMDCIAEDYKEPDLLHQFLHNTIYERILDVHMPFSINRKTWLEHGFIAAKTGHGKTQLLQALIYDLIQHDRPGMFVIDSQGSMIRNIERITDCVVVRPEEVKLNIFKHGNLDSNTYDLFAYLFSAIDADLTGKQAGALQYILRLMNSLPDPSLETLKDICEAKPGKYDTSKLDSLSQDFFERHFYGPDMKGTRVQLARRLYQLLGNETFRHIFSGSESNFDAFALMQNGKTVLLDTSEGKLGIQSSAVLGRFYIAQILTAAYRRPENERRQTFLIVDEAAPYFDDRTEMLLSKARKFGLASLWATQYLEQIPSGVKAAIYGNTAIKFAAALGSTDAMLLGREMFCNADFIRSMKKHEMMCDGEKIPFKAEYACHVHGQTDQAVKLTVPFFVMEKAAPMKTTSPDDKPGYARHDEESIPPETHEGPTEAEPSRDGLGIPAEADHPIIPPDNNPQEGWVWRKN